jgi:hypothetical protein
MANILDGDFDRAETLEISEWTASDIDKIMYHRGLSSREETIASLAHDGLKSRWPLPLAIIGLLASSLLLLYITAAQGVRFDWVF